MTAKQNKKLTCTYRQCRKSILCDLCAKLINAGDFHYRYLKTAGRDVVYHVDCHDKMKAEQRVEDYAVTNGVFGVVESQGV
ncbi:MAG: hypothetical protein WC748_09860 [Legionellales bacterium]|jgi:hypothetical protein